MPACQEGWDGWGGWCICLDSWDGPVSPQDCRARDEQFSLIFTLASFMINFMTFPMGYIFDRFKTTVARLIAM